MEAANACKGTVPQHPPAFLCIYIAGYKDTALRVEQKETDNSLPFYYQPLYQQLTRGTHPAWAGGSSLRRIGIPNRNRFISIAITTGNDRKLQESFPDIGYTSP